MATTSGTAALGEQCGARSAAGIILPASAVGRRALTRASSTITVVNAPTLGNASATTGLSTATAVAITSLPACPASGALAGAAIPSLAIPLVVDTGVRKRTSAGISPPRKMRLLLMRPCRHPRSPHGMDTSPESSGRSFQKPTRRRRPQESSRERGRGLTSKKFHLWRFAAQGAAARLSPSKNLRSTGRKGAGRPYQCTNVKVGPSRISNPLMLGINFNDQHPLTCRVVS